MGLIGTLNSAVAGTVISPSDYNENFASVRDAYNASAVLIDVARIIMVQHTFAPSTAVAPFALNANAQGVLVTGLNADQLDSQEGSYYRDADNLNAGTVPTARISGSYTGITAVGTLTAGSIPASLLTGTIASTRISGSYTGITAVGSIATGVWQGTPVAAAYVGGLPTSKIDSGTFLDARIAESNVTQHQGALAIATSQVTSGTFANARIAQSNVTQHEAALAIAYSQMTGNISEAQVTQHEGALSIGASQVGAGTFSGAFTFSGAVTAASLNLGTSTLTDFIIDEQVVAFPSLSSGSGTIVTVTVTGAALGDVVYVGYRSVPSSDFDNLPRFAYVSATNEVKISIKNYGSATTTSGNEDLTFLILKN